MEVRGSLIYEHPVDFARTIDLVASGKLTPGATAGQPQPLESVPALLEAMEAGKLDAKPLIAMRGY
jgi:threonine dehydrogenase-like Zn-dependent dehydrogenase